MGGSALAGVPVYGAATLRKRSEVGHRCSPPHRALGAKHGWTCPGPLPTKGGATPDARVLNSPGRRNLFPDPSPPNPVTTIGLNPGHGNGLMAHRAWRVSGAD